jgi:hypothetical protein
LAEEHPLVRVGDEHPRIDALFVAVLVVGIGEDVDQAIGAEAARHSFLERIVARLLRLEVVAVGPVDAVQRVGGLLVATAPRRPEVGNDPVLLGNR